MATNKSYQKRIRVTKNGKLLARKPGQNHFNAKESGSRQLAKKRLLHLSFKNKVISRYLS